MIQTPTIVIAQLWWDLLCSVPSITIVIFQYIFIEHNASFKCIVLKCLINRQPTSCYCVPLDVNETDSFPSHVSLLDSTADFSEASLNILFIHLLSDSSTPVFGCRSFQNERRVNIVSQTTRTLWVRLCTAGWEHNGVRSTTVRSIPGGPVSRDPAVKAISS